MSEIHQEQRLTKKFYKEEFFKLFLGIITLTVGIYLGLIADKKAEKDKVEQIFKNIIEIVKSETTQNDSVIALYSKYAHSDADIKSQTNYSLAEEFLKSETWIEASKPNQTILLIKYISLLKKLDAFKVQINELKKNKTPRTDVDYIVTLKALDSTISDYLKTSNQFRSTL